MHSCSLSLSLNQSGYSWRAPHNTDLCEDAEFTANKKYRNGHNTKSGLWWQAETFAEETPWCGRKQGRSTSASILFVATTCWFSDFAFPNLNQKAIPVELYIKFKSLVEEPDTGKLVFVATLVQRRFHPEDLHVPHFHYRIGDLSIGKVEPDRTGDIIRCHLDLFEQFVRYASFSFHFCIPPLFC